MGEASATGKALLMPLALTMASAANTVTSPLQACWKTGSTRPSGAHGSYSRPRERLNKQERLPKAIRRIRMPNEDLERFQTVGDTVDYV